MSIPILAGCAASGATPRLAVVITVDMFPADLLERHADLLSDTGFKRLMKGGAYFTDARFDCAITLTGPGHATIATGANPADHGIVANYWYEPGAPQAVNCVDDPNIVLIRSTFEPGGDVAGQSSHRLAVPTLGDQLKRVYGAGAKVWSCSLKDRAAILSAGRDSDGALWWDPETGDFISSTQYFADLPDWVREFNQERLVDTYFDKTWDHLLPLERYTNCDDDNVPYEDATHVLWTNSLPKPLGKPMYAPNRLYYERLRTSPFGNDVVFAVGQRTILRESLGMDDVPDLLAIGLSSHDFAGHSFGTDSHEVVDMLVRTDRQLGRLLGFLDERVGLDHCVVVLTGDHGAGPVPEYAKKQGLESGRFVVREMFNTLTEALRSEFGSPGDALPYLKGLALPWAYLDESVFKSKGIDLERARAVVARAAETMDGVEVVFTKSQVAADHSGPYAELLDGIAQASYEGRSGDVYIHTLPNWTMSKTCCDHRTAHPYDTHVPLIFFGPSFKAGRFDGRVAIRDIAPTLSAAFNMQPPPTATGRPLTEALR